MTTMPADTRFSARLAGQDIEQGTAFAPKFDADGLIAAIVSDHATGEVLMFAWMTAETLALSIDTGEAHFWSRSRRRIWRKGEESGNTLRIVELRTDCDQDALLLRVEARGTGVACHTGARSCFYRRIVTPAAEGEKFTLAPVAGG
jgi:phosphoribosyl-AMP cyclohydrolase